MKKMKLSLMICISLIGFMSYGQIMIHHTTSNIQILHENAKNPVHLNNDIERAALSIPFIDDFSYPGPFPDADKWVENQVFINNTLANAPVSLGVATFDGISKTGRPYENGYGSSDTLTSREIDLSSVSGNVHLKYWLQAKGNGEKPEAKDSLIILFKDNSGQWNQVGSHKGWSGMSDSIPAFSFEHIIIQNQYKHASFQFRFVNYSGNVGILDLWHLDHVVVDKENNPSPFVNDISFTQVPSSILKKYRNMPAKQFIASGTEELSDNVNIGIYNHFSSVATADSSALAITEIQTNTDLLPFETLLEIPPIVAENQRNLSPGDHMFVNAIKTKTAYFEAVLSDIPSDVKSLSLKTNYRFKQNLELEEEYIRNNEVSRTAHFSNYYAYDDGSAELGLSLKPGSSNQFPQLAVRYHAYVADTLSAIQIAFPFTGQDVSNEIFNLKIWIGSLDDQEVYKMELLKPKPAFNFYDTLQGVSTYSIQNTFTGEDTLIIIPPGDFYIGWQQISTGGDGIPVGFDINNPGASTEIFFNPSNSSWVPLADHNADIKGAFLLRPLFGSNVPDATNINQIAEEDVRKLIISPNPAHQRIQLSLDKSTNEHFKYQLLDINGRICLTGETQGGQDISVSSLMPGMYIIRVWDKHGIVSAGQFIKVQD